MNTTPPPSPTARRRSTALPWLLGLAVLVLVAWAGWQGWQQWRGERAAQAASDRQQLDSLALRVAGLRRDQRSQAARLQQADATNRVLRDELLGIAQRAALIEDSLDKLADPERNASQALRLDEVEWLLAQGQQRLQLAGDLAGARHAYALAAQRLDGIADTGYLDLRQVLAQERVALEALRADPRATASRRLAAFAAQLPTLPSRASAGEAEAVRAAWWRRALGRIVAVRRSDRGATVDPGERQAAQAALQLEISLARASAERRDRDGYRAALLRVDDWLARLWPPSPSLDRQRARLRAMRNLPLDVESPTLGSTLAELRRLRDGP